MWSILPIRIFLLKETEISDYFRMEKTCFGCLETIKPAYFGNACALYSVLRKERFIPVLLIIKKNFLGES